MENNKLKVIVLITDEMKVTDEAVREARNLRDEGVTVSYRLIMCVCCSSSKAQLSKQGLENLQQIIIVENIVSNVFLTDRCFQACGRCCHNGILREAYW